MGHAALPGDEIRLVSERCVQEDDRRRRAQRRDQQGSGRHARRGALGARMDHGVEILQAAFRGRSVARIWFHAPLGAPELGRGPGPTCPRVPTSESRLEDVKSAAAIPSDRHTRQRERVQRRGLAWAAAAALLAIGWLAHPLATGLFLGALMGFALEPLYDVLRTTDRAARSSRLSPPYPSRCSGSLARSRDSYRCSSRGAWRSRASLATALSPGGSLTPLVHSAIALSGPPGLFRGESHRSAPRRRHRHRLAVRLLRRRRVLGDGQHAPRILLRPVGHARDPPLLGPRRRDARGRAAAAARAHSRAARGLPAGRPGDPARDRGDRRGPGGAGRAWATG